RARIKDRFRARSKTFPRPGREAGVRQNSSGIALILTFSPREKEERAHSSGVANDRPANPVACFFDAAADDSPSPGLSRHSRQATAEGEGRGEVEPRRILHPQGEGGAGAQFWCCE